MAFTRLLTIFVLVFAAPGAADVVEEAVAYATGSECCDEGSCDDDGGEGCPTTCLHCAGCAHPSTVVARAYVLPACEASAATACAGDGSLPDASGYRTPPFRPPAA